ncbi:MAG: glutamate synthase subunit alpha, partial [Cocleimonas sp.]|nr:glutamate synthase subunit alpha [Cocleimonas sp.]
QSDRLNMRSVIDHWKAQGLDYSRMLTKPLAENPTDIYHTETQDHGIDKALDHTLIAQAQPALTSGENVSIAIELHNYNRTFGTMLSGEIAQKYGINGLPDDTISIKATGTAGQSLGAWLMKGVTLELEGEGNDYVGKGISGGKIIIYPPADAAIGKASENIIAGNTLLFGAIAGEAYLSGVVGERFCVRNSGVKAVVEGVGNHGCEYMTGGIVTVLGDTGRNFAAGMSGGMAYVLDAKGDFASRCNMEMVELERIEKDRAGADLNDLTTADETRLKGIVEDHYRYTTSERAKDILDNWDDYLPQFIKVMPVDYKRALEGINKA